MTILVVFIFLLYHRSSFSSRQEESTAMSSTSMLGPLPPDVNRGSELLIVIWPSMSIALLLVSLRFWIRGILRKNLGWDDYLILLASVSYFLPLCPIHYSLTSCT